MYNHAFSFFISVNFFYLLQLTVYHVELLRAFFASLSQVHFKFDLMQETLYLTVTLLDRYLSQVQIKKNEMQLVGLTALLLASKYEDFWHPRVGVNLQTWLLESVKLKLNLYYVFPTSALSIAGQRFN